MGLEHFRNLLNRDPGAMIVEGEDDRLCTPNVAPAIEGHPKEQVLLVRLDGSFFIESVENASVAAASDPDFVVAIPLSRLRLLINRSVN